VTDTAAQIATAKDLLSAVEATQALQVQQVAGLAAAVRAIVLGPPTRTLAAGWGDGVKDATAAIQMEIDALAVGGGVVKVPAGRYMVDAVKSITVRSGVTLELDPSAILEAKPNSSPRYYILKLEADAVVQGGRVLGDRMAHTYTAGSTHEWGYGVMLAGDRCKLLDTVIAECTGDGIGLSGDNVEIRGVISTRNRRQGMSVFAAKRARIFDSEFSFTGSLNGQPGALPMAGVDIEPDGASAGSPAPVCEDIQFIRCSFINNESAGIKSYKNNAAGSPAVIRSIRVEGCEIAGNTDGAWFSYCEGVTLDRNNVHDNKGYGLHLLLGTYTSKPIEGNEFQNNLTRISTLDRTPDKTVMGLGENRDLKVETTAGTCEAGENTYR
jgi:nitrous oxidase accessory protein NosD